nr:MAG TPA: hypothetical protein [Caudoviricetes sp.]
MDYPFGRLPVCENWQPSFYMWEDYYLVENYIHTWRTIY